MSENKDEQRELADKLNREELDRHAKVKHDIATDIKQQQEALNVAISQVNDEKLADALRKQKNQLGAFVKEHRQ
jgi:hypothetical protein